MKPADIDRVQSSLVRGRVTTKSRRLAGDADACMRCVLMWKQQSRCNVGPCISALGCTCITQALLACKQKQVV